MFIDTHAHIHQHALEESSDIVDRAVAANVGGILTAGTTVEDSQKAIDMAAHFENVFAGVGVHPTDLDHSLTADDLSKLSDLAASQHVVVMSEIGIDHQEKSPSKEWQAESFHAQINIARKNELPIVFHIREHRDNYDARSARDATISILKETNAGEIGGTAHYFQGRWDFAKELLDLGFNISFAKTLTHKTDLEEIAINVPEDRMLLETDAYPQMFKKNRSKWTEPKDIAIVAKKLAALRGMTAEDIQAITTNNALNMLGKRAGIVENALNATSSS
ncbi:MAG: TatD family hydrolase [Dehalococcoidia bacterium]|nr:TatD family hydrolase [Dehalococcoidia bacterium]